MQWKLAIFDWDGTLADTKECAYTSICMLFRGYGFEPPPQSVYEESINEKHKAFYHDHGIPETVSREELSRAFMEGMRANIHLIRPRKHARELLMLCKERAIPTAIVSGASPEEYVLEGMDAIGLTSLVDHVRACATTKVPELREVLRRFGILRRRGGRYPAFYVDDTHQGVRAAREAELTSIAIEGGFNSRKRILEAEPEILISCLSELTPSFLESGIMTQRVTI